MSVVGAHSVGWEWAGLILAIFLGDELFSCYPILDQSGAAWSDGWPLGDYLQSCPPRPTSLVSRPPLASLA